MRLEDSDSRIEIEEAPEWVVEHALPSNSGTASVLLSDRQLHMIDETVHVRTVLQIQDEGALQKFSHVEIPFDPAIETLKLHRVVIRRDGDERDCLSLARAELIQPERDSNQRVYDGNLEFLLFLDDLREGDIIDYSYSMHGINPALNGEFAYSLPLVGLERIEALRFSVIVPAGDNKLQWLVRGYDGEPEVVERDGEVCYGWHFQGIERFSCDEDQPSWSIDVPKIQVSTFASWADVASWAGELYTLPSESSAQLKAITGQWMQELATDLERTKAAVQFVQDKIRFLGLEGGERGVKPDHPDRVLERRYGDCKDKTLLLHALLNEMGIRSEPSLVNTVSQRKVALDLPSPEAFNHAILRVWIDGEPSWVDATNSFQGGGIKDPSVHEYGYALPASYEAQGLEAVSGIIPEGEVAIYSRLVCNEDGMISLHLKSGFFNVKADELRRVLKEIGTSDYEVHCCEWARGRYGPLNRCEPLTVDDNRDENCIFLGESYELQARWLAEDTTALQVYPFTLADFLPSGVDPQRTTPLALESPLKVREVVSVELPEGMSWGARDVSRKWAEPALEAEMRCDVRGNQLLVDYRIKTLRDHVTVDEMESFQTMLAQTQREFDQTFVLPRLQEEQQSVVAAEPHPILLGASAVGVFVLVSVLLCFMRRCLAKPFA